MRIVTNGTEFAIVRGRWIFTQFFCKCDCTWDIRLLKFHKKYPILYWDKSFEATLSAMKNYKCRKMGRNYNYYWDV